MTKVAGNSTDFADSSNYPSYEVKTYNTASSTETGNLEQIFRTPVSSSCSEPTASITTTAGNKFTTTTGDYAYLYNPVTNTSNVHVSFGGTATTNHPHIAPGGALPISVNGMRFAGNINCRTDTGTCTIMMIKA